MYVYMSSNEFECLGELVGDNYSFYFFPGDRQIWSDIENKKTMKPS